jgi:hypothetical protein
VTVNVSESFITPSSAEVQVILTVYVFTSPIVEVSTVNVLVELSKLIPFVGRAVESESSAE